MAIPSDYLQEEWKSSLRWEKKVYFSRSFDPVRHQATLEKNNVYSGQCGSILYGENGLNVIYICNNNKRNITFGVL